MSVTPIKIVTVLNDEGQTIGKFPLNIVCDNLEGCSFSVANKDLDDCCTGPAEYVEICSAHKPDANRNEWETHTLIWKVGEYV